MKDLSSTSFGYVIGFLLPGIFGIYALSYWYSPVGVLLQPILQANASVGPSVVLLFIAVGMGVCLGAARWAVFEKWLYRKHQLPSDLYKGFTADKLPLLRAFAEEHYRYHQFYGGCFIALLTLFLGWIRIRWAWSLHTLWIIIGFTALETLLERGSHDAYCKYTGRCNAIAAPGTPAAHAQKSGAD